VSAKREMVNVGISRRVLRIGAAAYPVQNIARAQTVKLEPNRAKACRRFFAALVLWVTLGGAAAVAANKVTELSNSELTALRGVEIAALVLVVVSTIRLIVKLSARTYYALVIETAGTPRTALVSAKQQEVSQLVDEIMAAVDDPAKEFHYHMENVQFGGTRIEAGRDVYTAGRDQKIGN
jgi:Family of unknown function (DUF6232)